MPRNPHKVTLIPVWTDDEQTSKLLGTQARRIVAWTGSCECGWSTGSHSWSDARYLAFQHRRALNG